MSFLYSRTVRLADADAAGVIYFANVLNICHEAYEEALTASGVAFNALVSNPEMAIPIVRSEVDFFGPIRCGDRLLVNLTLQELRSRSFELAYTIVAQTAPDLPLAKAKTRHVCIHPQTREKVSLPDAIARSLLSLDGEQ